MAKPSRAALEEEYQDWPDPPTTPDLSRPVRRLALAILLQAAVDFTEATDPKIWADAGKFLFPEGAGRQEYFRQTVECSELNPRWLRERLTSARERIGAPMPHQTCRFCGPLPASSFWSKRRGSGPPADLLQGLRQRVYPPLSRAGKDRLYRRRVTPP